MAYPGKLIVFSRPPTDPRWSCDHRRDVLDPRTSPYVPCPGCREANRRYRSHWSALVLASLISFLLTLGGLWASCTGGAR